MGSGDTCLPSLGCKWAGRVRHNYLNGIWIAGGEVTIHYPSAVAGSTWTAGVCLRLPTISACFIRWPMPSDFLS